jgi:hypothetical protein
MGEEEKRTPSLPIMQGDETAGEKAGRERQGARQGGGPSARLRARLNARDGGDVVHRTCEPGWGEEARAGWAPLTERGGGRGKRRLRLVADGPRLGRLAWPSARVCCFFF